MSVPDQYRAISPYIKVANDFRDHDKVLYYWVLTYALEKALAIGNPSTPEAKTFFIGLLDGLEKLKSQSVGDESYTEGPVAQCHVEAKALRLFTNADEKDRQGVFDKNVIKSFYTSGLLFDVLTLFNKGEVDEKLLEARKYAKWKATYLNNCLKNGTTPTPGPPAGGEADELTRELMDLNVDKPQPIPRSTSNQPAPPPASQFNAPTNPSANYNNPAAPQNNFNNPPAATQGFGWQQPSTGYESQNFGAQPYPPPQQQHHHQPVITPQPTANIISPAGTNVMTIDDFIEARRLTKMAASALDYEDAKTAVDFLRKALKILEK